MAAYTVTHKQVIDGVATVQVLQPINFEVGQSVTITNMGAPFNGTHVITALPEYLFTGVSQEGDYQYDYAQIIPNQVQFALSTAAIQRQAVTAGNLAYSVTSTWITLTDLEDYLGFSFGMGSSPEKNVATLAVGAANQFAYRRRQEAGYWDSPSVVPSSDVKLASVQYAAILYRERGSAEAFASFDPLATGGPVTGNYGQILRLLGVGKPQVA